MALGRTNCIVIGGVAPSGLPVYTYTGNAELIDDGGGDWRLFLKTSGDLAFSSVPSDVDVFLVGGGQGGSYGGTNGGVGGGGGYTKTVISTGLTTGVTYPIVIGAGSAGKQNSIADPGGNTSAFGISVYGANADPFYVSPSTNYYSQAGSGGCGGGAAGYNSLDGKNGGTDGGDGADARADLKGGVGQGTTTREFGEANGTIYSGGGGGGARAGHTAGIAGPGGGNGSAGGAGWIGQANTGGGGGGGLTGAGAGGSGVVVIRNHRS